MTARDTSKGEKGGEDAVLVIPTDYQPLGTLGCDIFADSYRRVTDLGC